MIIKCNKANCKFRCFNMFFPNAFICKKRGGYESQGIIEIDSKGKCASYIKDVEKDWKGNPIKQRSK